MNIESKLRILLYDAEINIGICEIIQQNLSNKKAYNYDNRESFLALVANNSFFEAISIIHSLLGISNIGQKNELNLYTLLSKGKKDLERIQDEYRKSGFDKLRDQLIDHKDKGYPNEPETRLRQIIFTDIGLKKLKDLIQKMNNFVYNNFNKPFDPFHKPFNNIITGLEEVLGIEGKESV